MQTSNDFDASTIVCFKIGKHPKNNTSNHLSFLGDEKIGYYTDDLFMVYENEPVVTALLISRLGAYLWDNGFIEIIGLRLSLGQYFTQLVSNNDLEKIFEVFEIDPISFGDLIYIDGSGNPVGLNSNDVKTGTGRIEIDPNYDVTYCQFLSECDEKELSLIANYQYYIDPVIKARARELLDIAENY